MEKITRNIIIKFSVAILITIILLVALSIPFGMIPPLGKFLFPGGGVWKIDDDVKNKEILKATELEEDVTIFRDKWGIPHIYGYSEKDIAFALGYVQAQDRLFQMDMARRVTRGKLSEVIGSDALDADKFSLSKLKEYWALESLNELKESTDPIDQIIYNELLSYSAGINYYIKNMKSLPLEYLFLNFKPDLWSPVDTLCFIKYMSEMLSWGYSDFTNLWLFDSLGIDNYRELFSLPYQIPITTEYGDYNSSELLLSRNINQKDISEAQEKTISELSNLFSRFIKDVEKIPLEKELMDGQKFYGSNNWVIGGNKTVSTKPILCNDMHLGHDLPGIWYEAHLINIDPLSDFNVYGFFLAGVPFPIVGHNAYVGWGMTNTGFDVLDWYYYKGINETHYWYKGEPKEYTLLEFEIPIKNKEAEIFTVKNTVHGPVLTEYVVDRVNTGVAADYLNDVIACKWISHNVTYETRAIYGWSHSKNRDDFNEASNYFGTPAQNIVYADIHGEIGIRPTGKVPIRDDSNIPSWHFGNGSLPYNGSEGNGEWIGYVPFDFLPVSENPNQDYLVSANQVSAGSDYQYHLQHPLAIDNGYRSRRLNDIISAKDDFTVEDMKNVQLDVYSIKAGNLTQYLIDAILTISFRTDLMQDVIDVLNDWDYQMDKEEAAPTIFYVWIEIFQEDTFTDEMHNMGSPRIPDHAILEYLTRTNASSTWFDDINTPEIETRDDIIKSSFMKALVGLEDFFGTEDITQWKWGIINTKYIPHITDLEPLAYGPVGVNGTEDTVNPVYRKSIWKNNNVTVSLGSGGASERMIIDFNNLNNSVSIIPSGQRNVSTSKHYVDQLEMYLRGEYHTQYFAADSIEKFQDEWIESTILFKAGD